MKSLSGVKSVLASFKTIWYCIEPSERTLTRELHLHVLGIDAQAVEARRCDTCKRSYVDWTTTSVSQQECSERALVSVCLESIATVARLSWLCKLALSIMCSLKKILKFQKFQIISTVLRSSPLPLLCWYTRRRLVEVLTQQVWRAFLYK